jgi:hypothetical protein
MKQKIKYRIATLLHLMVIFSCVFLPDRLPPGMTLYGQNQKSPGVTSGNPEAAIAAFKKQVKEYVKLREKLEGKLAKLSKDSTPEQIQAHKTIFEEQVRAARVNAKPGDIFRSDIASHIRATIREEFKGRERKELRETVLEADTKGVPLRVNYPYPETKELTQIPPTLLLKLPQLPKQVKYRFVGRHMLLVDRENGLIIDYMLNTLP